MAIITKTIISIPSVSQRFEVPGDYSPEALQSMYGSQIEGLSTMTASSNTVAAGVDGDVRTVVFSPRVGQKG